MKVKPEPDILKTVVKDAVYEEDRSRNVVLFGLLEEDEQDFNGRLEV